MKTCFKLKYQPGTVLEFKCADANSPYKYFHIVDCVEREGSYMVETMGSRGDLSGVLTMSAGYLEGPEFSVCTIKTMKAKKRMSNG